MASYHHIHRDIIEMCKAGDPGAQFQLYQLYDRAMYNLSYRMMNNREEAEDMLQEAYYIPGLSVEKVQQAMEKLPEGYRYSDHYVVFNRTCELEKNTFTPLIGIAGLAGLEYRFSEYLFVIGGDIKPCFEFSTTQIFALYPQSIGISLKYKF